MPILQGVVYKIKTIVLMNSQTARIALCGVRDTQVPNAATDEAIDRVASNIIFRGYASTITVIPLEPGFDIAGPFSFVGHQASGFGGTHQGLLYYEQVKVSKSVWQEVIRRTSQTRQVS